jgi:hypothetical protein
MVKMRDVKSLPTLGRVVVPSSLRSSSQCGVTYEKTCISLYYNMRFDASYVQEFNEFDVYVTVHHDKFPIIKPPRCNNFSNLFLDWNSTCFEQCLCPSSGVFYCTHSNGICHTGLLRACEKEQDGTTVLFFSCSQAVSKHVWHTPLLCVQWKTPDDGQRHCSKHLEFQSINKFEKLLNLFSFIIGKKLMVFEKSIFRVRNFVGLINMTVAGNVTWILRTGWRNCMTEIVILVPINALTHSWISSIEIICHWYE